MATKIKLRILSILVFAFYSCSGSKDQYVFYRIDGTPYFVSSICNKVSVERTLRVLAWPDQHGPGIWMQSEGSATLYIPTKDTSFFYIKDSSCIERIEPSYRESFIWLASNIPTSFTDSMIQIRLPIRKNGLHYRIGSSDSWKRATVLKPDEIREIINTQDFRSNRITTIPSIPVINEHSSDNKSISFSDFNDNGIISMLLNGDKITITPLIQRDAFSHSYIYPEIFFYDDVPNIVFFDNNYYSITSSSNDYSLFFAKYPVLPDTYKRTVISFYHSYYIGKNEPSLQDEYKVDDVTIKLSGNNRKWALSISDGYLYNVDFRWENRVHLWSSIDTLQQPNVTKMACSPRTFFVVYKLSTGASVLGGPSYKEVHFEENERIVRIDNTNYREENGIPMTPDDYKYSLLEKATGLPVSVEQVFVIFDGPVTPQVWYCKNPDKNRIHQLINS